MCQVEWFKTDAKCHVLAVVRGLMKQGEIDQFHLFSMREKRSLSYNSPFGRGPRDLKFAGAGKF